MTPWLIIIAVFIVVVFIVFLIAWCVDLHIHSAPEERKITSDDVLAQYQSEAHDAYKIAHFYWVRYNRLHKTAYDYKADDYGSLVEFLEMTRDVCSDKELYQDAYASDVAQCIDRGLTGMKSSRDKYRHMTGLEPAFPAVEW